MLSLSSAVDLEENIRNYARQRANEALPDLPRNHQIWDTIADRWLEEAGYAAAFRSYQALLATPRYRGLMKEAINIAFANLQSQCQVPAQIMGCDIADWLERPEFQEVWQQEMATRVMLPCFEELGDDGQ